MRSPIPGVAAGRSEAVPGALADGSLTAAGAADLCRRLPEWFAPLAAPVMSAGG
jgi:hypothetical protein